MDRITGGEPARGRARRSVDVRPGTAQWWSVSRSTAAPVLTPPSAADHYPLATTWVIAGIYLFEASADYLQSLAAELALQEYRMADIEQPDFTTLTVQLLSAYLSNNSVPSSDLPGLIESTRTALKGKASEPEADTAAEPIEQAEHVPAVTVRKSRASRDHLLSLIDGRPYKALKRHLSAHGLTPAEYRARYKLPKDYPMVAPGYSEQRREVAKRLGLGRKPKAADAGSAADASQAGAAPAETPAKAASPRARAKASDKAAAAPAANARKTASKKPPVGRPRKARAQTEAVPPGE